jgi:hypothetical protein
MKNLSVGMKFSFGEDPACPACPACWQAGQAGARQACDYLELLSEEQVFETDLGCCSEE